MTEYERYKHRLGKTRLQHRHAGDSTAKRLSGSGLSMLTRGKEAASKPQRQQTGMAVNMYLGHTAFTDEGIKGDSERGMSKYAGTSPEGLD